MKFILISCGFMLLFTNMQFNCKHGDGVSTWAKFDVICTLLLCKSISPLLCIEVCCCLHVK